MEMECAEREINDMKGRRGEGKKKERERDRLKKLGFSWDNGGRK